MAFHFPLQSVLNIRQHQRELLQQGVAAARCRLEVRLVERNDLVSDREAILNELRILNDGGSWTIDDVTSQKVHAEHLAELIKWANDALVKAESDLATSLDQLIVADQSVRAIELLLERQFDEHQNSEARIAFRESDDAATWNYLASKSSAARSS